MLSQGFGFISFKTREQAVKAWKKLNGSALDGHQLQMSFSRKRVETDPSQLRKSVNVGDNTSKIHVKNIPFQASKKEIKELFQYVDLLYIIIENLIIVDNLGNLKVYVSQLNQVEKDIVALPSLSSLVRMRQRMYLMYCFKFQY